MERGDRQESWRVGEEARVYVCECHAQLVDRRAKILKDLDRSDWRLWGGS